MSTTSTAHESGTASQLVDRPPGRGSRRRPSLLVVGTAAAVTVAVCVLAALVFSFVTPPVYGAEADLVFEPNADLSSFTVERDMATQQLILRSRAVLEPVATATGMKLDELERMVSVKALGESNILRITVGSRDRGTALILTRLITGEYLKRFSGPSPDDADPAITRLERRIETSQDMLAQILDRLKVLARERPKGALPSVEERELRDTSASTLQRMNTLQAQLNALESKRLAEPTVTLLTRPHPLDKPLRPEWLRMAAAGLLAGLVIAGMIALVLLRPRFRDDVYWE